MCSLKSESYVGSVTSESYVQYVTSENFVQSVTSESLCIVCDVGNLYAFQATTTSLKYFSDKFKYLALYGSADRQPKMALRHRNTSAKVVQLDRPCYLLPQQSSLPSQVHYTIMFLVHLVYNWS